MSKAGRGDYQYMVRLPEDLRDKIKESAEENSRSINSEIIAQLERAYDGRSEQEAGAREKAFEDALKMVTEAFENAIPSKWTLVPEKKRAP